MGIKKLNRDSAKKKPKGGCQGIDKSLSETTVFNMQRHGNSDALNAQSPTPSPSQSSKDKERTLGSGLFKNRIEDFEYIACSRAEVIVSKDTRGRSWIVIRAVGFPLFLFSLRNEEPEVDNGADFCPGYPIPKQPGADGN